MQQGSAPTRIEAPPAKRPHLKPLPLGELERMRRRGEADGWYVAEHDTKWALGLQSGGEHYLVTLGAQTMAFDSMEVALKYLRALIVPTGVDDAAAAPPNLGTAFTDAFSKIERRASVIASAPD